MNTGNQSTQQIGQNLMSQPINNTVEKKINYLMISVIILVCFVIFGLGGYYLGKQSSNDNNVRNSQTKTNTSTPTPTKQESGIRFNDLNDYITSDVSMRSILTLRNHEYLPVQSDFLTKVVFDVNISYYKLAKYYELTTSVDNFDVYIQYVNFDHFIETMPEEHRGTFLGYENYGNNLILNFPIPNKQKEITDADNKTPFYWTNKGSTKSFEAPSFCNFSDYVNLFDGKEKSTFVLIKICYPYANILSFDKNKFDDERFLLDKIIPDQPLEENPNFTWISQEDGRLLNQNMKKITNSFSFPRALVN